MDLNQNEVLTHLRQIDEYEFENFIADLWERQGWDTRVSQGSNDRGIDVVAEKSGLIPQKHLIQAKRYDSKNTVGVREIREYSSLSRRENVDAVIIATTSSFTQQAESEAKKLNVKLIEGSDIYDTIVETDSRDLFEEYVGLSDKEIRKLGNNREQIERIRNHTSEGLRNSLKPLRKKFDHSKYSTNSTLSLGFYDKEEKLVKVRFTYLSLGKESSSLKISLENRNYISQSGLSVFRKISGIENAEKQSPSSAIFTTRKGRLSTECEIISTIIYKFNPNFSETDEIILDDDDISENRADQEPETPPTEEIEYSDKIESFERKFDQYQ